MTSTVAAGFQGGGGIDTNFRWETFISETVKYTECEDIHVHTIVFYFSRRTACAGVIVVG